MDLESQRAGGESGPGSEQQAAAAPSRWASSQGRAARKSQQGVCFCKQQESQGNWGPLSPCLGAAVRRALPPARSAGLAGRGAKGAQAHLLGRVDPLDAPDARRAGGVHVGPARQVLGLREGPLGQRHLAGRLLSHFWGLGGPLGLAVRVKTAIALSSLLKGTRQQTGQCLRGRHPARRPGSAQREADPQAQDAGPVSALEPPGNIPPGGVWV